MENRIIRQITDYTLDELNEHIKIIRNIPDYIMDMSRRQYWIDQIKMRKNLILDDIEKKTFLFDRHIKVQKWIDKINKSQFNPIKYNNKYIYLNIGGQMAKTMSYHEFYFEHREEIESYFLSIIEKPNTDEKSQLNSQINLEVDDIDNKQLIEVDFKKFLEE